jgi:DNA modification methylase
MLDLAPTGGGALVSPEEKAVALMSAARQQLAQAVTVNDAKRVADYAAGLCEVLRRQAEVGLEIVNDGLLLRLQAEGRMGEFLRPDGPVKTTPGRISCQADTICPLTYRELGLDRKAAQRYREVATVPADLLRQLAAEATQRKQELTREAVLKAAKKLRPPAPKHDHEPPPAAPAIPAHFANQIITGDARQLAAQLPDGSVSLCFCDPIYANTDDYEWLARECERVLRPGGSVIAQVGNTHRYDAETAMRASGLTWVDLLAEVYPFAICRLFKAKTFCGWKPYLWFSLGPRTSPWVMNRLAVGGKTYADPAKEIHPWGDSEQFAAGTIGKLCGPGEVVWDPFTGSGTVPLVCKQLGLPFVAFEIDPDAAAAARDRIDGVCRVVSPQQRLELA